MRRQRIGMSSHQTRGPEATDVWLTPKPIIEALGPFDLDPCAAPVPRSFPTATRMLCPPESDGLLEPWAGFVWLNPPYSVGMIGAWMDRMALHGNGIALVFARTETGWFHKAVWARASAVYFPRGRLTFLPEHGGEAPGNAGAPSCFAAYGPEAVSRLRAFSEGSRAFVELRP